MSETGQDLLTMLTCNVSVQRLMPATRVFVSDPKYDTGFKRMATAGINKQCPWKDDAYTF